MNQPQYPPPPYGPQYPGYYPPLPPPGPAPKQKKRVWPWIVGGVVLVLFVLGSIGSAGTKRTPTVDAGAPYGTIAPSTSAAPKAPAVVQPAGPATQFGDGTWVVGEDIVAGTYKSTGALEGFFEFCSVTTYTGTDGDGRTLQWETANANEPVRIKVSGSAKSVKSSGCAPFVKVA